MCWLRKESVQKSTAVQQILKGGAMEFRKVVVKKKKLKNAQKKANINSKMTGDEPERGSQADSLHRSSWSSSQQWAGKEGQSALASGQPSPSFRSRTGFRWEVTDWQMGTVERQPTLSQHDSGGSGSTTLRGNLLWLSYPRSLTTANHHQGVWILPATVPGQEEPSKAAVLKGE